MQRKRGLQLGRPFGSPLLVHRSWLGAAALLVAHLAITTFGGDSLVVAIAFGVAAAIGVFASVVLHEGAHSLARRWVGVRTVDCTLFPFGEIARTSGGAGRPGDVLIVGLVGPFVNATIGVCALLFSGSLAGDVERLVTVVSFANLALAGLNLIPGLPLDGGRILAARLEARGRSRHRAVWTATRGGFVLSAAAVMAGIWLVVRSRNALADAAVGLWLIVLGVFLWSEAGRAQRASRFDGIAHDGTAGTWARPFAGKIRSSTVVPADGGPYAVSDGSRLTGIVLPSALATGKGKTAGDIMIPWTPDIALNADVPIGSAIQRLVASPSGVLVVLDDGGVVRGVIDTDGVRARLGDH